MRRVRQLPVAYHLQTQHFMQCSKRMVKAIMERHILLAEQIKTLLQIQRKLIGHRALILQTWFISK